MLNLKGEREFNVDTTKVRNALKHLYDEKVDELAKALVAWSNDLKSLLDHQDVTSNGGNYDTRKLHSLILEKPQKDVLDEIQKELDYYTFLVDETNTPEVKLSFDEYHKFFNGEWIALKRWAGANAKYVTRMGDE